MFSHTVTVSRSSITDPWPAEMYESIETWTMESIHLYINNFSENTLNWDISEDGLTKTISFNFSTQEELDSWKQIWASREGLAEINSLAREINLNPENGYTFSDNQMDF